MHKLLTLLAFIATLLIVGCSTSKLPGVYRPDIQQGNVVTQKMVNQLEPNMSKSQVKFILGTPLLIDVFHQNRWDYLYSMEPGNEERTQERITLFFEDDRLVRLEGDFRPLQVDELSEHEGLVHSVPDYKDKNSLLNQAMKTIGLESDKLPERVPMEPGEVTAGGREAVTTSTEEPATTTTAPAEESAPVDEDGSAPVEAPGSEASNENSSPTSIEESDTSATGTTTGDAIEPSNDRAAEPAPVEDLLNNADNPQGE